MSPEPFRASGHSPPLTMPHIVRTRAQVMNKTDARPILPVAGCTRVADQAPPGDSYLPLKALSRYAGIGVRTLRAHLGRSDAPLPHYRVNGKVLVRRSEFDAWIAAYRRVGSTVDALVAQVMRDLAV